MPKGKQMKPILVKGRKFNTESSIIYALVKRLGGKVEMRYDEIDLSNEDQGLVFHSKENYIKIEAQ